MNAKNLSNIAAAAALAVAMMVGCDKSETKKSEPAAKPASASPTTMPSAADMKTDAGKATDAAAGAADSTGKAVNDAVAGATGEKPADAADAAAGESVSKAQELMTQATNYIKDNKLDLAEKALAQLDELKPKLPASYAPKIDSLHTLLDNAKKGKGLTEGLKSIGK
jgi:hypothetical protein